MNDTPLPSADRGSLQKSWLQADHSLGHLGCGACPSCWYPNPPMTALGLWRGQDQRRGDRSPQGQRKARRAVPSPIWDRGEMFAPAVPVPAKRADSVSVTVNQAPFTRAKNALSEGKQNKNTKQNSEVKNSLTFLSCESPGPAERREPPEFVKQTLSHPRPRSARCRWNAKYIFKPCSSKESVRSWSRATCMWVWPREKTRDAENISWGWEKTACAHTHTHTRARVR